MKCHLSVIGCPQPRTKAQNCGAVMTVITATYIPPEDPEFSWDHQTGFTLVSTQQPRPRVALVEAPDRPTSCRIRPTCPSARAGTVDWSVTGRLVGGSIRPTILTLFALYILGIKG